MKNIKLLCKTIFLLLLFAGLAPAQNAPLQGSFTRSKALIRAIQNSGPVLYTRQVKNKKIEIAGKAYKAPGKAFFLSLILPGMGEYYVGASSYTPYFIGMEILAGLGWYGNNWYAGRLEDEYMAFAVQHAGVNGEHKDLKYWSSIGKYDDLYGYNEQRERDRNFEAMFDETPEFFWQWDSKTNRLEYDRRRLHANSILNQEVYFQLALVLNHLVSAVNALRLARRHNRQLEQTRAWQFRFESTSPAGSRSYLGLRLVRRF